MNVVRSFFTKKLGETILKNFPIVLSIIAVLIFALSGRGQTTLTYSTAGTFDWVVPPCVTSVTVRAWGGGGAGGGCSGTDRNGGGGGGGAFCMKLETVTPGETIRITVGAGGVGVSAGTGGAGQPSTVQHLAGSVVFCKAAGGIGGTRGASVTSAGTGGAGGSIANNIPAGTGFSGGTGGASIADASSSDVGGGGGGGAGTGGNGGNGNPIGVSSAGFGAATGGGNGGVGASGEGIGGAGINFGGGGGGSATWNTSRVGGAGSKGQVTITYVATGCEPTQSTFAYSTPGTYSWVVPACVNYVTVEAWGGGGGGGGNIAVLATSGGETCTGAGGGGGGGYAARTYGVTPGQTYTIVVGAGGSAGAAGVGTTASITTPAGAGGVGQSSTFSGPATVGPGTLTASGGNGGTGAGGRNTSSSNCLAVNGAAGTGGSGGNGSVNYTGGNGAAGLILDHSTDKSGGGGGAAGPGGNGGAAPAAGSVGVAVPPGGIGDPPGGNGGSGRMWNTPSLSQQNGVSGNAIGGGGGGSLIHTSSLGAYTAIGGTGGRGEVRLTYNTSCPLPIELLYFSGSCLEGEKTFNWSTATEHENQFFTIEHSKSGTEYYPVQIINGAVNSTVQMNYSSVFTEEDETFTYYRLKQTDTDGAYTYSDEIHVQCQDSDPLLVNPNPFDSQITIDLNRVVEDDIEIFVIDFYGRIVFKGIKEKFIKSQQLTLDLSMLSSGIYYLEIVSVNMNSTINKAKITKL